MTLAPDPISPEAGGLSLRQRILDAQVNPRTDTGATATSMVSDQALIDLADASGSGLVSVSLDGIGTALNPTGALLLEALGGADGAPAPTVLLEQLAAAALEARLVVQDTAAQTPESRHISITALVRGGAQLVALRDHTEERLLQERLLQSEKMASVGQLVSGVAHELNNPLTAVTGFAQILLARQDLDYTATGHIRKIYEEGERAAKIVQNLLSFARRRRPAKEMTDVNVLVERVLELRSYDFGMRNIRLDMMLDRHMARAWVDPDQIQQVFFNLVKNAEQAMTDAHGGGTLTVRTAPAPELFAYGGRGAVRVSIADDGPGIPPEVQRRIFDPFFTTKEAGQGTGLGLTISYSIIDEHNGRIWVENSPNGGAVFTIELPVAERAADLAANGASGSLANAAAMGTSDSTRFEGSRVDVPQGGAFPVGLGGPDVISLSRPPSHATTGPSFTWPGVRPDARSILVVDDEASIRLLLSDVLAIDGHHVDLAASGIEAMEKLLSRPYDLIISDIKMPGMDGATLFRELQAIDAASDAGQSGDSPLTGPDSRDVGGAPGAARRGLVRRLIFITGDTVSPDTRAFLGGVSVPVLTKPFRVGLLRETIQSVLA